MVRKYGVTPGEAMERYDSSRKRDMDSAAAEWRRANPTAQEIETARRLAVEREAVARAAAGNAEASRGVAFESAADADAYNRQMRGDSMPAWYANMPTQRPGFSRPPQGSTRRYR
jgi:hypothetical protein